MRDIYDLMDRWELELIVIEWIGNLLLQLLRDYYFTGKVAHKV